MTRIPRIITSLDDDDEHKFKQIINGYLYGECLKKHKNQPKNESFQAQQKKANQINYVSFNLITLENVTIYKHSDFSLILTTSIRLLFFLNVNERMELGKKRNFQMINDSIINVLSVVFISCLEFFFFFLIQSMLDTVSVCVSDKHQTTIIQSTNTLDTNSVDFIHIY